MQLSAQIDCFYIFIVCGGGEGVGCKCLGGNLLHNIKIVMEENVFWDPIPRIFCEVGTLKIPSWIDSTVKA